MPRIPVYEAPPVTLHPDQQGSAAWARAGAMAQHYGAQTRAILDREGQELSSGIASFEPLAKQAQEHSDSLANIEAIKNGAANDLATLDAIEGFGTGRVDANGLPNPSTQAFNDGTGNVLDQYSKVQEAERQQFMSGGGGFFPPSRAAQDRFALHQAERFKSVMIKAHSESHMVAAQEALGNVQKSMGASMAIISRHPEQLDTELSRFDETMSSMAGGLSSKVEAAETVGPKGVSAKAAYVTNAAITYKKNGQDDQFNRIMDDPKYDKYIGQHRLAIQKEADAIDAHNAANKDRLQRVQDRQDQIDRDQFVGDLYERGKLNPNDPKFVKDPWDAIDKQYQGDDKIKARQEYQQLITGPTEHSTRISHETFSNFAQRINKPYGDPEKLTDASEIAEARGKKPNEAGYLDSADAKELIGMINNPLSPDGRVGKLTEEFISSRLPQIDKSNPLMGKIDETGKANAYDYRRAVYAKQNALIQQKKDPMLAITPGNPDYMGTPDNMKNYQRTIQQSIQEMQRKIAPQTAPQVAPTAPAAPTPMKAPQNVTPEDIRKDPKTYPPNKDGSIGPIILPDGRSKMIPAAEKMSYAPETGGETAAQDAIQSALQNTARGAMAKLQKTSLGPPEEAGTPAAHTPSDAAMGGGNAAPMGRNALLTPETNKGGSPIEIASQFLGKNERANRAELAAFFDKAGGPHLDPVKTAWCARFVNSVLATAGIQGTGSDMARSFLRVGTPIRPQDATAGDVIVFPRGTRGTYGHVGFVKDINVKENTVTVISGNTAGGVRVNEYPLSRALGIRRIQQQHVGAEIPGVTDQTATA